MRSLATRRQNLATAAVLKDVIDAVSSAAGFDLIIVETAGIGQSDTEIVDLVDLSLYVMTSEYGAASQLEKIDMLDFADFIVLNKSEKRGAAGQPARRAQAVAPQSSAAGFASPMPRCQSFRRLRAASTIRASIALFAAICTRSAA